LIEVKYVKIVIAVPNESANFFAPYKLQTF